MRFIYPAVFHHEDDTSYWVEFPDLPGCFTDGDTQEDALNNAQEAMALYLEPDGETEPNYPHATDITDISQPENGFVSYVVSDVDLTKSSRSVKKTLTIPEWLNTRATQQGVNFSQVLQEALINRCY